MINTVSEVKIQITNRADSLNCQVLNMPSNNFQYEEVNIILAWWWPLHLTVLHTLCSVDSELSLKMAFVVAFYSFMKHCF